MCLILEIPDVSDAAFKFKMLSPMLELLRYGSSSDIGSNPYSDACVLQACIHSTFDAISEVLFEKYGFDWFNLVKVRGDDLDKSDNL